MSASTDKLCALVEGAIDLMILARSSGEQLHAREMVVQPPRPITWQVLSGAAMLTDHASLVAAARSAAADPRGAKPTGFPGEDARAMLERARKTNAICGGRGSRGARTTQMVRADATSPEA